jgi:beta-galactosidase
MKKVREHTLKDSDLWGLDQEIAFPLITKSGINAFGKTTRYYFNYSDSSNSLQYPHHEGTELFTEQKVSNGQRLVLEPWGIKIIEED